MRFAYSIQDETSLASVLQLASLNGNGHHLFQRRLELIFIAELLKQLLAAPSSALVCSKSLMHRTIIERDQLMQALMVVLTNNGVLEELRHRLVHVYALLPMGLCPDFEQTVVELHVQHATFAAQELDVKHCLVPLDVPMRVTDLQRKEHVRIGEDLVLVDLHDVVTNLMPLSVYQTNGWCATLDLNRRQQVNIRWHPCIRKPVVHCRAANDQTFHLIIVALRVRACFPSWGLFFETDVVCANVEGEKLALPVYDERCNTVLHLKL